MPEMTCNQCGHEFNLNEGSYCPRCGESLEDEFKQALRHHFHLTWFNILLLIVITCLALALCLMVVDEARHYTWQEDVTSKIVDKHESTYIYYINTGTAQHPVMIPMVVNSYYITLEDGHSERVDSGEYSSRKLGQDYTYQVTHRDWRPGMEGAPLPKFVWVSPLIVMVTIFVLLETRVVLKRKMELDEWRATGDLTVDD